MCAARTLASLGFGRPQLGTAPRRGQPSFKLAGELLDLDAVLGQRIAISQRNGPVVERLVVDRHSPRRADLVLAAVALADRAALVVLGLHPFAQVLVDLARKLWLAVL